MKSLALQDVSVRFGALQALDEVSLRLEEGVWRIDSTANSNINRD